MLNERRADIGLHDAIELFLTLREARNCEPVTVANYRRVLARFAGYPFAPAMVSDLTDDVLIAWLARLRRDGLGDGTVAYHQRHAWAFVHWLEARGQVEHGITRLVPRVLVQEVRRPVLSEAQLGRLLKVAGDAGPKRKWGRAVVENRLRNLALLRFLWATGLRRNEVCTLALDDVDLRRGEVLVRHAKGKKVRVVPFDAAAKGALAEYIVSERGREPGPLFLGRGRAPLTPDALYQMVSRLAARAGVEGCGLHAFRRGFAVRVRRAGLEMDHTQTLLGHATSVMTRIYSASGEEEAAIAAYRARVG